MATEPLTGAFYAKLTDVANIETTQPPGISTLAKFTIPRFSTVSQANVAIADSGGAQLHQFRWIDSLAPRGLQIFTGSVWEDYLAYTRVAAQHVVCPSTVQRTNTVAGNVSGFSLPVVSGAVYKVHLQLIYSTEEGANIHINATFPGGSSRLSWGITGKSPQSNNSASATDNMNVAHTMNRVSGDVELGLKGASPGWLENSMAAELRGLLTSNQNGTFQITYRRSGASGAAVSVWRHSVLTLDRIS